MSPEGIPVVPQFLVVHLGEPTAEAANTRVPFPDYLKNIVCGVVCPRWSENLLCAYIHIYAARALDRVCTDWYRKRGCDFDITADKRYDPGFAPGRAWFQNVAHLVDERFNDYLCMRSQEGVYFSLLREVTGGRGARSIRSMPQSEDGEMEVEDILRKYFGEDADIAPNAPVQTGLPAYPGFPVREGDTGGSVRTIQIQLNRVSYSFPLIPKIAVPNGAFTSATTAAVRAFQRVFDLEPSGMITKADWYALQFAFLAQPEEAIPFPSATLSQGAQGEAVHRLQEFLILISGVYTSVPRLTLNGHYGSQTQTAVIRFQSLSGLPADGLAGPATWEAAAHLYTVLRIGAKRRPGQFPGYELKEEIS